MKETVANLKDLINLVYMEMGERNKVQITLVVKHTYHSLKFCFEIFTDYKVE